jgi:hypothetical protein
MLSTTHCPLRSLPGDGQTSPISPPSLVVSLAQTLVVDADFQSTVQIERVPAQDLTRVFGDSTALENPTFKGDAVGRFVAITAKSVKITSILR